MIFQFYCPQGHLLQGETSQAGQQCTCPYCGTMLVVPQPVQPVQATQMPASTPEQHPTQQPAQQQPAQQQPAQQQPAQQQPAQQQPAQQQPAQQQPAQQQPAQQQPAQQQPAQQQPAQQQPASAEAWEQPVDQSGQTPDGFPGVQVAPDVLGGAASETPDQAELPGGAATTVVHVLCPKGHELETPRDMLGQDAMCPYCETIFRLRFEDSIEHRQQQIEEREHREMKQGQAWLHWSIAIAVAVILGVILLIYLAAAS